MDSLTDRKTSTGDAFGTPGYVAPEQAADAKNADARSDIFSLGRILYELYTGENPSAIQDVKKLDPGIAQIVERCTRTDPDKRFQDASELRTAFTNLWAVVNKETVEGRFQTHLANATAQGGLSDDDLADLADSLDHLHNNTDVMHEACVELPGEVITGLWNVNAHLVRHIIEGFAEQVERQGWGFDYVDTLGNACTKICIAVDDPEMRAMIARAIVEMSVSHNRWHVMDQAADILETYTSSAEDLAIAEALQPIRHRVQQLENRINTLKLSPNVAALFR